MRAIKSILTCAGAIKRDSKTEPKPVDKDKEGGGNAKKHEDEGEELI